MADRFYFRGSAGVNHRNLRADVSVGMRGEIIGANLSVAAVYRLAWVVQVHKTSVAIAGWLRLVIFIQKLPFNSGIRGVKSNG